MQRNPRYRTAVTAVVTVFLFAAACAHPGHKNADEQAQKAQNKLEQVITETVTDPDRAARLTELARRADELTLQLNKLTYRYRKRMETLNADYDAARGDFEQADRAFNSEAGSLRQQIIEAWFAMKETASEAEWEKIAKREAELERRRTEE